MSRFKSIAASVLVLATVALVVPSGVLAAHSRPSAHPAGSVFGSLVSIDANKAIIATKHAHIRVSLMPSVAYVSYDQAAALAGLKVGDQVDASGRYFEGILHADRLRYDTVPFVVSGITVFSGLYVSSTPASSSVDATITVQLKRGTDVTFNVDSNTRYLDNGKPVSSPPMFKMNDHLIVKALQFSDQSWLARSVNDTDASAA